MMRHAYPMPKLYSYTRFSTAEQGEGDSERRQMQAAAEFAAARGLELDEALKIADFGVSGYRLANLSPDAGLGKFMEAVRAGLVEPGSMLLLESLDRFSRAEPVDVQHELTGLIRAGIEIATLNDGRVYSRESLARCPVCGSAMTRVVKGKKGGAPKLVCTRAKAGNGCVYRAVPLAAVEAVILGSGADLLANIPAGDAESRLDARALGALLSVRLGNCFSVRGYQRPQSI